MTLNIVIMITIFSIIGEHKVNGDEYTNLYILASEFKVDAFVELNIVCFEVMYMSIYAEKLKLRSGTTSMEPTTQDEIKSMSAMLLLLNDWSKVYMDGELETKFLRCIHTTNKIEKSDLQFQLGFNIFSHKMTTSKFFITTKIGPMYIRSYSDKSLSINDLNSALKICKNTLNTFSTKIKILDYNKKSVFGYIFLLMTEREIIHFRTNPLKDVNVYIIMKNALQDIFVGLASSVDGMSEMSPDNINQIIMINEIVIDSVIDLSQKLFFIVYYQHKVTEKANDKILTDIQNYYKQLINYFKYKWQKTLAQFYANIPKTREIDEEFKTTSQLIKNNKVEPSIIGYYAAYMNSLEDTTILEYNNTDKDKILFLMEINAWTKILLQQSTELEKLVEVISDDILNDFFDETKKEIHELFEKTQTR